MTATMTAVKPAETTPAAAALPLFSMTFRSVRKIGHALDEENPAIGEALQWGPTREHYLAWRAAWRTEMAEIVDSIHQAKRGRRTGSDAARNTAQYHRLHLRGEAWAMLLVRTASKKRAGAERAARLAALGL
jgi:hypothetical protein